MTDHKVYEIDGAAFSTLEGFYDAISRTLIPDADWGRNLDALNDVLRGGFGTPNNGFVLLWKNSQLSRDRLGYTETVRQLEQRLRVCHSTSRPQVQKDLDDAKAHVGPTMFDRLVAIITDHGPGGGQAEDRVELRLE